MMTLLSRRDFLRGLGVVGLTALLARHHGATVSGREGLIQWGKENGVLKPQWQGKEISSGISVGVAEAWTDDGIVGKWRRLGPIYEIGVDHACPECDMTVGFVPLRLFPEIIYGRRVIDNVTAMPFDPEKPFREVRWEGRIILSNSGDALVQSA